MISSNNWGCVWANVVPVIQPPMLSSHVGVILHRDIVGLRFVGFRRVSSRLPSSEPRKCGSKSRSFCSGIKREEVYRPSYDSRKKENTYRWPTSRKEELESLAKKVHPDATLKKADPDSFSFRVQVNERVSPSRPDEFVEPVSGLLKPPPMVQKTDPFVLQQHKKRAERRAELLSLLRRQTDTLTISQVNEYYDQLRDLDFEDLKEGFEPQYFTRAQLVSEGVVLPNVASSVVVSSASSSVRSSLGRIGNEEWSLADTALRRKFLEDLLVNEAEHVSLASSMPSAGRRLPRRLDTLSLLNTLSLYRLFGLCMQTVMVAPWAVLRGLSKLLGSSASSSFWQFESEAEALDFQKTLDAKEEELKKMLQDLKEKKSHAEKLAGKPALFLVFLRTFPVRWLWFMIRLATWYPLLAAYKVAKVAGIWAYFTVYGTLDVAKRSALSIAQLLGGSNGRIASSIATAWNGLAPHTWKRYYLGDPLGTLWDRGTGHSEHVLQQSKDAFNAIGYGLERGILGFFHSNRLIGLLILLAIAIGTAQTLIEPDLDFLEEASARANSGNSSSST